MKNYTHIMKVSLCLTFIIISFNSIMIAGTFNPALQKEFVIVDSVQNYNLNPHSATYASEAQILTGLSEGLFSYNPSTLEPVPALAETTSLSKNKLVWTFTIRKNALFSNGDVITAQTIKDSWIALLDPQKKAPYASLLDCIDGAEDFRTGKSLNDSSVKINVLDTYTLEVTLTAPAEHFSKILCHHAFSVVSPKEQVWSGPFTLTSQTEDELILTKNPLYWDAANVALPSIKITLSQDDEKNTYLYNIGRIHWLCDSISYQKILVQDTILIAPLFATEFLFFNATSEPWNNPDLRTALIHAVPWDTLREQYIIPAETLVFPLNGYPRIKGISEQNMEKAKSLLEKAGYSNKSGKAKLKLIVNIPDFESYVKQMKILADAWNELGILVDVVTTPSEQYQNTIKTSNADMFSYIWIGDFADPLAFLELFRGNSSLNESRWKNNAYDKLLIESAKLTDQSKRYKKLSEAEQVLIDSGVILPLSHTVSVNVIEIYEIGGWHENALDIHPLKNIYFMQGRPITNMVRQ